MKSSVGIIGVGAFGEFMLQHIAPYFRVLVYDKDRDFSSLADTYNVKSASIKHAASADVVILSVPVQAIEEAAQAIATFLRPGCLVLDVASVKMRPLEILQRLLPANVDIIGTHPLFGPQSGRLGIKGLNLVLCDVGRDSRNRLPCIENFAKESLGLKVFYTTPEQHDRELAYVQGLTHLLSRIFKQFDFTGITLTTKTFDTLMEAFAFVSHDSEALFMAIENENPFVCAVKDEFFQATRKIEKMLCQSACHM